MSDPLADHVLRIAKERRIRAPIDVVYATLLEQLGPLAVSPHGDRLDMRIEPFPGGRWWRDLGDGAGHLWAHVQAIKPPGLIELTGPMFLSHAVVNNVQYRLEEEDGVTVLRLVHEAFGVIPDWAREGVRVGWDVQLDHVAERATA